MTDLVTVKALVAFTRYVPNYGMVHADPENSEEAARNPRVPASAVAGFADEGLIEAPEPEADDAAPVDEPARPARGGRKPAASDDAPPA